MANNDVVALRDKTKSEMDALYAALEKVQAEARKHPEPNAARAEVVARVREAKYLFAVKNDEYCELARTAATLAGGTNHRPQR
jgi:hypothetical protein